MLHPNQITQCHDRVIIKIHFMTSSFRKIKLDAVIDRVTLDMGYKSLKSKQKLAVIPLLHHQDIIISITTYLCYCICVVIHVNIRLPLKL